MKLEEMVGKRMTEAQFDEAAGEKDACYRKVKARYDVWPSAYASGALVKCRKVGAANWGNSKKEGVNEVDTPMFKITYKDSVGRKETDIMRAKNHNLAKRDFNTSNKGRGFKILSVVKEGTTQKFKSSVIDKAVKIAKSMGGNMTAAVKKIEKIEKNLSKNGRVEYALQQANEGLGDRMSKKLKKHKGTKVKKVKLRSKSGMGTISHFGMKEDVFIETNTNGKLKTTHVYYESDGKGYGYTLEFVNELNEAEYQGRKVKLGKIMQGDAKKFKVYVKNPKGNVVKVNFGQGGEAKGGTMRIRKSNPKARKSFRARHNCDNPGPRHKARYWSCRKW